MLAPTKSILESLNELVLQKGRMLDRILVDGALALMTMEEIVVESG
jgi:hypothetical protein